MMSSESDEFFKYVLMLQVFVLIGMFAVAAIIFWVVGEWVGCW